MPEQIYRAPHRLTAQCHRVTISATSIDALVDNVIPESKGAPACLGDQPGLSEADAGENQTIAAKSDVQTRIGQNIRTTVILRSAVGRRCSLPAW
jgi:hypothetical protein